MKIVLCGVLFLALSAGAHGQSAPIGRPDSLWDASDSATLARTLYRQARDEMARHDTVAALRVLSAAAYAWPLQPAYTNALLDLALRARSESRAAEALRLANATGYALPSSDNTNSGSLLHAAALQKLLTQQNELRASKNNSRDFRWLSDSTLFPEGLSFDMRSGTMYVSSIYRRNIAVIDTMGKQRWLLGNGVPDIGAIFGVVVDTARNVIWAASAANPAMKPVASQTKDAAEVPESELATLVAIRLSDGKIVKRATVPSSVANASPGDIALMSNGDVLTSDSQAGVLWWLQSGSDSLIGIRHRLLHSPQGIVPSADSRIVWVADYSHGLLRVDLITQRVERVADLPGHSTVGIDGLVQYKNTLIAVQNGFSPAQVLQIELNSDGTRIIKQMVIDRTGKAPSPTGGAILNGDFIYIANSLWESLDASGKLDTTAALPRPLLLKLPLKQ